MTKLYAHPTGVWSSVDAFHSIGEPENFNQIVRRGKYAEPEVPSEPTRAMDLVELSDLKCSLLVRQTDDGAIWWQKFSNEPVRTEKEQFSEQKKSLERIIERRSREPDSWKREPWRPVYSDGMCEEVREKPEDFRWKLSIFIEKNRFFWNKKTGKISFYLKKKPIFSQKKLKKLEFFFRKN